MTEEETRDKGLIENSNDASHAEEQPQADEISPENSAAPDDIDTQRHNQHVQEQALVLFDRTRALHGLSENCRDILEYACQMNALPFPGVKKNPFKDAKILISDYAGEELSADQVNTLAVVILFTSGRIKRKTISKLNLSPLQQREVQTLSALLMIADGLDRSGTHATTIQHIESSRNGIWIVVDGPEATTDASEAQQNARLWFKIGFPKMKIMEPEKAETKLIPFPEAVTDPGIEPGEPLSEAGRKVMGFHFLEMLRHEEGTRLGEDIEELHNMRVATGRLRAAFEVFKRAFKPGALKPHLRGVRLTGRTLGKVRDLDIFMEKASAYLAALPEGERDSLDPLMNIWREQRHNARQELLVYLDSEEYYTFKRKFNAFLKTPGMGIRRLPKDTPTPSAVREIAPMLIYQRLAWVKSYEPYIENATVEQLHNLRIEFKKLCYTVEYFQEVLGPEVEDVLNDLKVIQDQLGDLVDAQVACENLGSFLQKQAAKQSKKGKKKPATLDGVETYRQYQEEQRDFLLTTFPETWAFFKRPEFSRKLAQAVSVL